MSNVELHVLVSLQTAVNGGVGFAFSECAC
jgi:hypothetical protein